MDSLKTPDTVKIFVDSSKAAVESSRAIIDSLNQVLSAKSGMDGRTFIVEILKGLGSFAWPAMVLFAVWHFRKPIANLIERIRTIDGTKLSFGEIQEAKEKIAAIDVESEPIKEEVKEVTEKLIDSDTKPEREQLIRELEDANKRLVELETLKKSIETVSDITPNYSRFLKHSTTVATRKNEILHAIFRYIESKLGHTIKKMPTEEFVKEFDSALAKIHSGDLEQEYELKYLDLMILRSMGIIDFNDKLIQPRGLNLVRIAYILYRKRDNPDLM